MHILGGGAAAAYFLVFAPVSMLDIDTEYPHELVDVVALQSSATEITFRAIPEPPPVVEAAPEPERRRSSSGDSSRSRSRDRDLDNLF